MGKKKRAAMLVRMSPALRTELNRWAATECRSANSLVEYLLTQAVRKRGKNLPLPTGDDEPDGGDEGDDGLEGEDEEGDADGDGGGEGGGEGGGAGGESAEPEVSRPRPAKEKYIPKLPSPKPKWWHEERRREREKYSKPKPPPPPAPPGPDEDIPGQWPQ